MADDVVYYLKAQARNEELRYSLRSLRNLEHGTVWMGGACPRWVDNVRHVAVAQVKDKQTHALASLRAVLEHPELSPSVSIFNDDFYVIQRFDALPVLHRGPVRELIAKYHKRGWKAGYVARMSATLELLQSLGHADPLSYELHCPFTVNVAALRELFDRWPTPGLQWRTVYGNLHDIGGDHTRDFKWPGESPRWDESWPFFSSSDTSFAQPRRKLSHRFPHPSPYERPDRSRELLTSNPMPLELHDLPTRRRVRH